LGIVPTTQALERAREAGLDLVEVAADELPPVCKILDYGKMRFKNSQKGNKATKVRKQRLKEIRVRPKTGDHDIDTKIAHARKFLEHNDKVQVTVMFRGREMQHQGEGWRVLGAVLAGLAGVGKVERPPAMDGKRMTVLLMPIKAVATARAVNSWVKHFASFPDPEISLRKNVARLTGPLPWRLDLPPRRRAPSRPIEAGIRLPS
jgi:translation initiation factor IF-3